MKGSRPLRSLLAGAVLLLAGCATTDDRYELPALQGVPPPVGAGGGSTPFVWYYGPGDVPRLNAGPSPYYDPHYYYRYGGLPPRYYGPFPYGYGPGYGPGFGLAYGPEYGQGYPFGPYWPYATAPCRDSNRNGRCDAYEPRPPKPPKPPKPPRQGGTGDVVPQPGDGRANLPPLVAPGGPRYVPRVTPVPPPAAPSAAPSVPSRVPPAVAPPYPRAAPPKPADRGDERERPRRRLPQVEPEPDR